MAAVRETSSGEGILQQEANWQILHVVTLPPESFVWMRPQSNFCLNQRDKVGEKARVPCRVFDSVSQQIACPPYGVD